MYCGQRTVSFVALFLSFSSVSLINTCTFQRETFQSSHTDFVFCPQQPPIVLAPINCTQTAMPQTEGSSTKPEQETTEATGQSEDWPQRSPQETPTAEKDEGDNKSN